MFFRGWVLYPVRLSECFWFWGFSQLSAKTLRAVYRLQYPGVWWCRQMVLRPVLIWWPQEWCTHQWFSVRQTLTSVYKQRSSTGKRESASGQYNFSWGAKHSFSCIKLCCSQVPIQGEIWPFTQVSSDPSLSPFSIQTDGTNLESLMEKEEECAVRKANVFACYLRDVCSQVLDFWASMPSFIFPGGRVFSFPNTIPLTSVDKEGQ